ncbi:OB-fold nucleic acid binding domain-containing protein [Geminocystis sp. NIES-3709]|uniref:helix-hairpin-helix domain-containing protein n=1 Tax=Geminocystis sp. NIES-3709 TaxID=1617448 RepID=UPI0005FC9377|nr:OB-fold nucleic acid binding domain-containing protein [Geminocystis sp. NIES-3709]BAQ65939.1 amino-terminal intein-mediated trans-splice [Geminocystis sp. NIES-3709]
MVKILKRRSISTQSVYDIGVEKDHNFLLGNGLVASNCFNKSHSTAYAYVTYQTAYLKANYPVEYMSALLTASSDNQEKIEKYRENCLKIGIDVKPPNINYSHKEFTPQGTDILFGFSAVKNLGESAIDNIIEAREKAGGKFTDFADFMTRINLKTVNRRALETLVYAGAFDSIHSNRRQLIEGLDLLINWSQKRLKEKETGQLNVFDLMLGNNSKSSTNIQYENAPQLPKIEDFSPQEKLKSEKEHLGFYVSEHPLKPYKNSAKLLNPIDLNQLSEQKSRKKICVIAMLTTIKKHIDKNNNNMAFLTLEDISGQADGIVFASNYDQVKDNLIEDTPLIVWGKADNKDDKSQIIINHINRMENIKIVYIQLSPEQASHPQIQGKLKSILEEQSGDKNQAVIPTMAVIDGISERIFVRFGDNYWVQNADNTVESLKNAGFFAYLQPINH